MDILAKLTDIVGGSLFKEVKDVAMAYFPPDMTDQQKAHAELGLRKFAHVKEIEIRNAITEAEAQFSDRIAAMEGTTSDLKTIPYIGGLIIFLRGVQRPAWGFATMVMDFKWFFGSHTFTETQDTALLVVNFLVLGFLFGERALKNLEPLIARLLDRKGK